MWIPIFSTAYNRKELLPPGGGEVKEEITTEAPKGVNVDDDGR